jgi:hypothetical protein
MRQKNQHQVCQTVNGPKTSRFAEGICDKLSTVAKEMHLAFDEHWLKSSEQEQDEVEEDDEVVGASTSLRSLCSLWFEFRVRFPATSY